MKKILFLLLVSIASLAVAQPQENSNSCPKNKANCPMVKKSQCPQASQDNKYPRLNGAKRGTRTNFLEQLSEADRVTVKGVMDEYNKECKAVREKYQTTKPAQGEKPTDEQMDAKHKTRIATRIEIMKLQEKYYDRLRKTLTPWQAATMLKLNPKQGNRPKHWQCPKGQRRHCGNMPR